MDQITEQPTNTPALQTQQPAQTPPVPPSPAPAAQKQTTTGYFEKLFSGRTNRRNFIIGLLILIAFPLALLLLDFVITLVLGFLFPSMSISNLSITPGAPLPHNGPGDTINGILTLLFSLLTIVWLPFFLINYFALLIRRLHDLNKTGWLCLLNFIPFVNILFHIYVLFFPAKPGENKYGSQPLPRVNIKQDILKLS